MQNGQTLGFALTGSYCTFQKVLPQIEHLVHLGYRVIPILSEKTAVTDTRFGTAEQIIHTIESITGETVITAIPDAEPIGPKKKLIAAQKEPEKYRNLVVRVTGYSGYFTRFDTDLQNDIIRRTVEKA